jgi:hypothetical protein
MITFEHHGITVKCRPENAAEYRRLMDKPPKVRSTPERRAYPQWMSGMTTGDYIQSYARLNDNKKMIECGHTCENLWQVPTLYDANTPEMLEELDADWAPPPPKARKITAKQAIVQALDALKLGDIDTAQCILTEALK